MQIEDARIAYLADLPPRTLVRPGSHAFTTDFRIGMVVGLDDGKGGVVPALMALDGEHAFTIFLPSFPVALRLVPLTALHVDGIDDLDSGAGDTSRGALTIRSGGTPVLRAQVDEGYRRGYVDLGTGLFTKLDSEELRESFLAWSLVAVDANSKCEEIVAAGPSSNQKGAKS